MVRSILAAAIGALLVLFGGVGTVSAGEIVEKQRREGMAPFADGTIDDATRVRLTRVMAIVFVLLGLALIGYGVGVVGL